MKCGKFVGIAALAVLAGGSLFSISVNGQTTAPAATVPVSVESVREQLIALDKMRDEGLVTGPEYEAARTKLLASIGAVPTPPPAPPPAPAAPPPPAPAPPPPPPAPSLLPTFAGRWAVTHTRVDTFAGQVIETPEHAFNWIVTVQNGAVTISREEEVVRFAHRPEIVLTPQEITAPQLSGKTLTFSVKQTEAGHEHTTVLTHTYQLQLGAVDKITGTYTLDVSRTEPHGVTVTHEGGNVALVRLPG
jgi:hypothetical protein